MTGPLFEAFPEPQERTGGCSTSARRQGRPRWRSALWGVFTVAVVAALVLMMWPQGRPNVLSADSRIMTPPVLPPQGGKVGTQQVFGGLGTWLSIYEFAPAYQSGGAVPPVGPRDVTTMAANGVRTLFLQTAGTDSRTSGPIVNPNVVGQFLTAAHRAGIRVVGWYDPTFIDESSDLSHLEGIESFRSDGQRFDGIAVDIEDVSSVTDPTTRSERLVQLSRSLRRTVGSSYQLGAVVIPPVLLQKINPTEWPEFPWSQLRSLYDVWIPMCYWTFRSESSGYRNPENYVVQNVKLLRQDLGDPSAAVHVLGGVADDVRSGDYRSFVAGGAKVQAIGMSIFTYRYLDSAQLTLLGQSVPGSGFDPNAGGLGG